ncbi:sigma-54 dependent transcriptional regulator [Candidatus Aminicenantes bacterium AH-873-B07]|nr:sigma-54 dependent transcriptional regulator [Candidatus Aminicenantes bacterium AH-873-B07]
MDFKKKMKRMISIKERIDFRIDTLSDYERMCIEFLKFYKKDLDFMWEDEWFKRNFNKIKRFSHSDEPVLLIGETGTGKEIISRFIHFLSKRKKNTFYPINCSALSDELLQSELFGHERGAYTSADRKREGRLKSSDGGTVFLDEIQTSSHKFQQALLRFLDYKEIQPLGSDKIERTNVRIITACCKSPEKLLKEGKLLEPFYYRISFLRLYIPPLRERKDIKKYIYYFLLKECHTLGKEEKEISYHALEALKNYPWPGNLRELKGVIHNLVLDIQDKIIKLEALPEEIKNPERWISKQQKLSQSIQDEGASSKLFSHAKEKTYDLTLDNAIKTHIQKVLELTEGNKTKASKLLGIPLTTLISKMKKLGMD